MSRVAKALTKLIGKEVADQLYNELLQERNVLHDKLDKIQGDVTHIRNDMNRVKEHMSRR